MSRFIEKPHPENPNLTITYEVPVSEGDALYMRHFGNEPINVRAGEQKQRPAQPNKPPIDEKKLSPIQVLAHRLLPFQKDPNDVTMVNGLIKKLLIMEDNKEVIEEARLIDVLKYFEYDTATTDASNKRATDRIGDFFENRKLRQLTDIRQGKTIENIEELIRLAVNETALPETALDELVANVEEFCERAIMGNRLVTLQNVATIIDKLPRTNIDDAQKTQLADIVYTAWTGQMAPQKPAAGAPSGASGGIAPNTPKAPQVAPQKALLSQQHELVRKLETELVHIMRRALEPLYSFVSIVSLAINDTDPRRLYRYKNQKGVTLEELQNIVVTGARTATEFIDKNRHLGKTILTQISETITLNMQDTGGGGYTSIGWSAEQNMPPHLADGVDPAGLAALRAHINQYEYDTPHGMDTAHWYWCALPYASFRILLDDTPIAAFDWALSEIRRHVGERGFTVPLLIKSMDTRDQFAKMVRNRYILTTGQLSYGSIDVGPGGARRRFLAGPGYKAQLMRAGENFAGKIWFENVFVVNRYEYRHQRAPVVSQELIRAAEDHVRRTRTELLMAEEALASATSAFRRESAQPGADMISLNFAVRNAHNATIGLRRSLQQQENNLAFQLQRKHCYETMSKEAVWVGFK